MPAPRKPLSAVLIVRDAAGQIAECLSSLSFCDEIIVVDSGSTDGTPELAERLGARLIRSHWRGFGPQKQFAVEQATHDWVLCLDADERVSPRLRDALEAALLDPSAVGYRFARCNRFMGRYLRHGEGYPDWSLRLFDRRRARWSEDAVHEKVIVTGRIDALTGDLLHHSEETVQLYLEKQEKYSTLAAQIGIAERRQANFLRQLLSPIARFVKFYFLRLGFLDGWPGLVHILIGCRNSYMKYKKMREMQKTLPTH